MDIPSVLEQSFIKENIDKLGWKGEGTEKDPIIIEDDTNLPVSILFKTDDLHIHIKDIDLNMIILNKCQNIKIEDSTISFLKLKSCSNVVIRDNLIRVVKNFYGKDNIIENNRLYSVSNVRRLTVIMFFIAISAGSLSILSYILEQYLLQDILGVLFGCSVIFVVVDIVKKRSKRFLPKNIKKNEFIGAKQETIEISLELEETTEIEKKKIKVKKKK